MNRQREWLLYGSRPAYASELLEVILRRGEIFVGALDNLAGDPQPSLLPHVMGRSALSGVDRTVSVVLTGGDGAVRRNMLKAAIDDRFTRFTPLIDPTAVIASTVEITEGVTINALAVIGSHSRLGRFVQINRAASIGHDAVVHDFVTVGPSAVITGFIEIGEGAFIGAGAIVRPRTIIGANSTIGAGAVVTKDVPPHAIVIGNPARTVGENPLVGDAS
jgi:sugar O-acyltransferase (sialic acid O-acetyltransferase NeuD family)